MNVRQFWRNRSNMQKVTIILIILLVLLAFFYPKTLSFDCDDGTFTECDCLGIPMEKYPSTPISDACRVHDVCYGISFNCEIVGLLVKD